MKDLTASNSNNSIVMRVTSTWLTNFNADRTRATYKKAIEVFATFAELESACREMGYQRMPGRSSCEALL